MVFAGGFRAARQLASRARASSRSFRAAPLAASATFSSAPAVQTPAVVQADVTAIVASVAAVGAIVGVGKMWWDASSGSSSSPAAPARFQELSQHEVARFFEELSREVQSLFVRPTSRVLYAERPC
jgi:hypothetical protein